MSTNGSGAPKDKPTPRGITELVSAGLDITTAVPITKWVNGVCTDKEHRERILHRLRKAGRQCKHVGNRDSNGAFAYVYFVFDKWVMPSDTNPHEPIIMDTIRAGGGKTREDGRRKLTVYAKPDEMARIIIALHTITNGASLLVRYANDSRGTVWLTVDEDDEMVERVVPKPAPDA